MTLSYFSPRTASRAAPYFTDARIIKLLVAVNGIIPLILLTWDYFHKNLGADPAQFALHTTGLIALIFLLLTLAVTPLKSITQWNPLNAARRPLGLYAFFYACIHLSIYFFNDANMDLNFLLQEIQKRFFLLLGISALALMLPLAITSNNLSIQRLGPARWKLLHKAVYFVAILAVIHYCLFSKLVSTQQYIFALLVAALLLWRFINQFRNLPAPNTAHKSAPRANPAQPLAPLAKPQFWKGSLRIAAITPETPHVRTFRLESPLSPELPFDYLPGQYLNLTLNIHHQKVTRSFTIASTPTRKGYLEISVKREPAGTATNHLHDSVQVGDLVQISAPAGRFTFTGSEGGESNSIVLIAGGVGITPLIAVIRYLTDTHWPGQIHLAYSARTEPDIIFRQELDSLAQSHPNLHVHYTLTQPTPTWQGHTGRLTTTFLQQKIPNLNSSRIHLCGPGPMIQSLIPALQSLNIPATQIHHESFTRAANTMPNPDSAEIPTAAIENPLITFTRSNKSLPALPNETLLETAERAGIPLPSDCRAGICGTCKTHLLTGQVRMQTTDALTPRDRAQNTILACQAHPLTNITLDV